MTRMMLRGFAVAGLLLALAAGALAGILSFALRGGEAFERLVGVAAAWYSADGVVSPAGRLIIQQTAQRLAGFSGLAGGAALAASLLLRRCLAGTELPEPPEAPPEVAPRVPGGWRPGVVARVAAILLAAAALSRAPMLFTSLSYDEVFSIQRFATRPLVQIPLVQEEFNNHVLNSLFLHAMLAVSSAEAVLRLPAFAAGILSLGLFFWLGRYLGDSITGLMALGAAAITPYHVVYSTMARGYILSVCLVLLGLWCFIRAGRAGRPRWLVAFGASQALAAWAMPTTAAMVLFLAMALLSTVLTPCRRWFGVDVRTAGGARWLLASLSTGLVITALNLHMVPFLLRMDVQNRLFGPAMLGSNAGQLVRNAPVPMIAAGALIILGSLALFRRARQPFNWQDRFLLLLSLAAIIVFWLAPSPPRVHTVAFVGAILLGALGTQTLFRAVRRGFPRGGRWLNACVLAALAAAALAPSAAVLIDAGRGIPAQDIRGAVRRAEAWLPPQGNLITSGFARREAAYYATRRMEWLGPDQNPAALLAAGKTFCYFRLYGRAGEGDPVFDYFRRSFPPDAVFPGTSDTIAQWCFGGGRQRAARPGQEAAGQFQRPAQTAHG